MKNEQATHASAADDAAAAQAMARDDADGWAMLRPRSATRAESSVVTASGSRRRFGEMAPVDLGQVSVVPRDSVPSNKGSDAGSKFGRCCCCSNVCTHAQCRALLVVVDTHPSPSPLLLGRTLEALTQSARSRHLRPAASDNLDAPSLTISLSNHHTCPRSSVFDAINPA